MIKLELSKAELDKIYSALLYRSKPGDPLVRKLENALQQAK